MCYNDFVMKSLRYLYRIGYGPSSSHSIGPYRIAKYVLKKYPDAIQFDVTLYGSFALTGRGHMTDKTIVRTLAPIPTKIYFDYKTKVSHPNSLKVDVFLPNGKHEVVNATSPGGGAIHIDGEVDEYEKDVYPERNFGEIRALCLKNNWTLADYVRHYEGEEIFEYLKQVYEVMMDSIKRGLKAQGQLPGRLHVERRAHEFAKSKYTRESETGRAFRSILSYAFAVGEENAAGGKVVTAPTCGSAATMPAVIKFYQKKYRKPLDIALNALAVGGVIGNVIKTNASISGAEAGCQAEIGSACSMAAAAYAYLKGLDLDGIECAAEVAMEHSIGSTCDPVGGYVQIPCIERNAVAAIRAVTSARLAEYAHDTDKVWFDEIVATMYKTGKDMRKGYRETAKGGLAKEMYSHRKGEIYGS